MPNQFCKPDGKALLSPTLSSRCGRRARRRLSAVHTVNLAIEESPSLSLVIPGAKHIPGVGRITGLRTRDCTVGADSTCPRV